MLAILLAGPPAGASSLDPAVAERFARLALACVHKEHPDKIAHVLNGDADVHPPRALTPAFRCAMQNTLAGRPSLEESRSR